MHLRHANGGGRAPVLSGYAVRWGDWTTVDSAEGHFMETFAPSFKLTLDELD